MLISILSTLISSIALLGVAISLFLQARQLRASQIQAARASQVELIKFTLDNPAMAAMAEELEGTGDAENFVQNVFRNWYFVHLSMSYDTRATSKSNIQRLARVTFMAEGARRWWEEIGHTYDEMATSKREKEFYAIVDGEFQRVSRMRGSAKTGDVPPDPPIDSSPPSS
jgi:hypothetical protein